MYLLENRGSIITFVVLIFHICISCNQNSDKAVYLEGNTIFLSYNEHLNYISIDSLYITTPKEKLGKVTGSMVTFNDTLVNFNYSGIYQCSGCKYLELFFREGNLIENLSENIQEKIIHSITEDNVKVKLLPMIKIKVFDSSLKIGEVEITDSTKINLRRINLSI